MKTFIIWTLLGMAIVLFGLGTLALLGVGLQFPDTIDGIPAPVSILSLVGVFFSVGISVRLLAVACSRAWRSVRGKH